MYDPAGQLLTVGDGQFGPLAADVWAFSVSGLHVVPSWLRQRTVDKRARSSRLDALRPREWTTAFTRELLELVWVLEATLPLKSSLDAVLDDIVSGGRSQTWTIGSE